MKSIAAALALSSLATAAMAQDMTISRAGTRAAAEGPAANFTGKVRVQPLFAAVAPNRASGAYVTFEPGARSAWHSHPQGQTLVVTAGTGRIQSEGGPVQEIRSGDVIYTPPGVKHWHGAAPTSSMTHLALQESADGKVVEWLQKVTDAEYLAGPK
jgi:quercetin dioxygenase-like cupin family protein